MFTKQEATVYRQMFTGEKLGKFLAWLDQYDDDQVIGVTINRDTYVDSATMEHTPYCVDIRFWDKVKSPSVTKSIRDLHMLFKLTWVGK